jgi:hypothetical protein
MARVEIPAPGDLIMDSAGNVRVGVSVSLKLAGTGTDATHYSALTGGTSTTGGLVSGVNGDVVDGSGNRRYVDSGVPMDMLISGRTKQLEPLSAASTAAKPLSTSIQYVDADNGLDANDGLSWGTPKLTLSAARTALPNGGKIWLNSTAAEYQLTSALDWGGYHIEGVARASGGTKSLALIRHKYNGNMMDFGAKGGFLRNVLLYEDNVTPGRTGAAIAATSSTTAGGFIVCENVVISADGGATFAWERDVVLDGSAWVSFGVRKCVFINCEFFGCRTAGETIKITRGVHCKFVGGFVDQAPTAVQQGVKLLDAGTTDAMFSNFECLGDFSTEATGRGVFVGRITGTLTCQAGSSDNIFIGDRLGATFTNLGAATNTVVGVVGGVVRTPDTQTNNTWIGHSNNEGAVSGSAASRNSGNKTLRVSGTSAGGGGGLVEAAARVAISEAHGYNSFPDPGTGGLYVDGNVLIGAAGSGLRVKEGSNAKMGVSTLVAGTVVVSNTSVTANSRIFLDIQTPGGTPGFLRVSARTAGTSFTILSSSGTDTSVVGWMIVEPA